MTLSFFVGIFLFSFLFPISALDSTSLLFTPYPVLSPILRLLRLADPADPAPLNYTFNPFLYFYLLRELSCWSAWAATFLVQNDPKFTARQIWNFYFDVLAGVSLKTFLLWGDFRLSLPNPDHNGAHLISFFFLSHIRGRLVLLPHDTVMLFLLATMRWNAVDDFTFTFTSATFINKSVEFLSRITLSTSFTFTWRLVFSYFCIEKVGV